MQSLSFVCVHVRADRPQIIESTLYVWAEVSNMLCFFFMLSIEQHILHAKLHGKYRFGIAQVAMTK